MMSMDTGYRYPGSRPFKDNDYDRRLFFARKSETEFIFHSILVENLLVLYGRSGLGKTSLLNAGVAELLRVRNLIPLPIRFNNREISPITAIYDDIEAVIDQRNKEVDKKDKIDIEHGEKESLWQYFSTSSFWTRDNKRLTPVLIFDQFEEFFSNYSPEKRKEFVDQLADLIRERIPQSILDTSQSNHQFLYNETSPKVKLVISMKEEFLGALEEFTHSIPLILNNRFKLSPFTRQQAKEAIEKPGELARGSVIESPKIVYQEETVNDMLDFLCEKGKSDLSNKEDEIEPFQIQLLCQHIENEIVAKKNNDEAISTVKKNDLGGKSAMEKVFRDFYETRIKRLPIKDQKAARNLCERGLVHNSRRIILYEGIIEKDYGLKKDILSELVNSRILHSEPRLGGVYYELSHDKLINPIIESMKERKGERKKKYRTVGSIIVCVLLIFAFFILQSQLKKSRINELYVDAERLESMGSYQEALKNYETLLQLDKNKASIHIKMGKILFEKQKDFEESETHFMKAREINPKLPLVYKYLGLMYKEQNKMIEAMKMFNKASRMGEEIDDEVYIELTEIYINGGEPDKAISVYRDVINKNKEKAYIYDLIDEKLRRKGNRDIIKNLYRNASEVDLDNSEYYANLAYNFRMIGDPAKAVELYKKAIGISPNSGKYNYIYLGEILEEQKKYKEAIDCYKKAIEIDPGYTDAYTHIANLHIIMGEIETAIEYSEKGLESGDKEEYAEYLYKNLALLYVAEDKPDKALDVYRKAIDVNVSYATIYTNILKGLEVKRLDDKAEELCRLAFGVESENYYYYKEIGEQFQRLKKYNEAIKSYRKALILDPKNYYTYKSIAQIYIEQEKAEKVIDIFKEAIAVDPTLAEIYGELVYDLEEKRMDDTLLELTEIAVSVSIENSSYYKDIGDFFYRTKKYGEAIKAYKKSLTTIKESQKDKKYVTQRRRRLYRLVVVAYVAQNRPKGVIDTFRDVIAGDSRNISIYYKEAADYLQREYIDDTLLKLTEIAAGISIEDGSYYARIGSVFFENDRGVEALKNYDRALTIKEKEMEIDTDQYIEMAKAYITLKKPEKAIEIFKRATASAHPMDYLDIYREISELLRLYKLHNILERLLVVASKLEVKKALYYACLGYDYGIIEKHEKSFSNYQKAIKLDPENFSYKIELSMLEILNQNLDSCYNTLKEILKSEKLSQNEAFKARFAFILVLLLKEKKSTALIEIRSFIEYIKSQPIIYVPQQFRGGLSVRKRYLKRVKKLKDIDRRLLLKMIEVFDSQSEEKKAENIADLTKLVDERYGSLEKKKQEE